MLNILNQNLKEVYCPTCGVNANRHLIFQRKDGISFYNCIKCNIEYASPRLEESSLLSLYEGDDWRDKAYYENWSFDEWKKNHGKDYFLVQENIRLVKKFLQQKSSILDVGCDIGLTVKTLEESNFYAEGIEVSEVGAKIAKNITGVKVHNTKLENFKSVINFDGVLLLDVLEHLDNPLQVLEACAQKLKHNGYIFIHTPHHKGFGTRYKKFLHKVGLKNDFKHFGFPQHLYGFDKKSLTNMLDKVGFEAIHFESWSNKLTNGQVNIFNSLLIELIKKYSLSDYIVCVARKR
jgi:SAM-dependent methyltransferase